MEAAATSDARGEALSFACRRSHIRSALVDWLSARRARPASRSHSRCRSGEAQTKIDMDIPFRRSAAIANAKCSRIWVNVNYKKKVIGSGLWREAAAERIAVGHHRHLWSAKASVRVARLWMFGPDHCGDVEFAFLTHKPVAVPPAPPHLAPSGAPFAQTTDTRTSSSAHSTESDQVTTRNAAARPDRALRSMQACLAGFSPLAVATLPTGRPSFTVRSFWAGRSHGTNLSFVARSKRQ